MENDRLRVVLFSHSADGFAVPQEVCEAAGHSPVAYVYARALRPGRSSAPRAPAKAAGIVEAIPAGVDLLLPGRTGSLEYLLAAYRPDLLICNGFPWKLPRGVLDVARIGAINVHTALLPRYRGPIPIHWAIRNGDSEVGVTVHWMDEDFDTGRVIVQRGGVPLEDEVDPDRLFRQLNDLTRELLPVALERVRAGRPGEVQREADASYAGWMEEEFSFVDWSRTAREIHNQVRAFRFGVPGPPGPLADVDGRWMAVLRTSIGSVTGGIRVECGDGPIWIVESEVVQAEAVPSEVPIRVRRTAARSSS